MTAQQIAEPNTILRCTVGSALHGLSVAGTDDRDEMGVCLEPQEYVVGLRNFEQWTFRTQPEGARSGPGDLDLTIYSLRKWARLALGGNPTIMLLLFAPRDQCSVYELEGEWLQRHAAWFASKRVLRSFLGYMHQQKERLLGERGQMRVKRPELVERYGFDTKYAGHVVRLGLQGLEYASTAGLTLPMVEADRDVILGVRTGEYTFSQTMDLIDDLESRLLMQYEKSMLPDEPAREKVDRFLIECYQRRWAR